MFNNSSVSQPSSQKHRSIPVDTGRRLNVHKTFRRRLLNVLSTFNLRPVSTGIILDAKLIFDKYLKMVSLNKTLGPLQKLQNLLPKCAPIEINWSFCRTLSWLWTESFRTQKGFLLSKIVSQNLLDLPQNNVFDFDNLKDFRLIRRLRKGLSHLRELKLKRKLKIFSV